MGKPRADDPCSIPAGCVSDPHVAAPSPGPRISAERVPDVPPGDVVSLRAPLVQRPNSHEFSDNYAKEKRNPQEAERWIVWTVESLGTELQCGSNCNQGTLNVHSTSDQFFLRVRLGIVIGTRPMASLLNCLTHSYEGNTKHVPCQNRLFYFGAVNQPKNHAVFRRKTA